MSTPINDTVQVHTPVPPSSSTNQTLGILSLVGGIASLVFGQTIILPVAAIVLGVMARNREPASRAIATWGIILSVIALFGWILVVVIAAIFAIPLFFLGGVFGS